ncbi:MAG: heparinase II/III family protein, partial [Woeseiaceae bacterium]
MLSFVTLLASGLRAAESQPLEHDADLPDTALFAAIDLERPGLALVRAAVDRGDMTAAREALAGYFRTRTAPRSLRHDGERPAPYPGFNRIAADQLVAGTSYTAGRRGAPPDTGYQTHLSELADAYWWTGDSKYAGALAAQLQRTARDSPATRTFHPLSASVQAPNAIAAWQALRSADEFTTGQRIDVLKGLLAKARWLNQHIILEKGARTMNITWMIAG